MGILKTTNIQTITGSGTITLGASGETISIPSGVTTTLTDGISGNLKFDSGYGSPQTAYGVRVWLRYDQVNNVIEASGGVSSVTDSSTGSYVINFTNTMPDADYAVAGWSGRNANPTVTGASNFHNVGNITINTGDSVNNSWVTADVDDSTVIIVK